MKTDSVAVSCIMPVCAQLCYCHSWFSLQLRILQCCISRYWWFPPQPPSPHRCSKTNCKNCWYHCIASLLCQICHSLHNNSSLVLRHPVAQLNETCFRSLWLKQVKVAQKQVLPMQEARFIEHNQLHKLSELTSRDAVTCRAGGTAISSQSPASNPMKDSIIDAVWR